MEEPEVFLFPDDHSDDHFRDECGVFAIVGHPEAASLTYLGLYGLQHRGQESAGIVSSDGERLYRARGVGYVADVFDKETLRGLPGHMAIGHVRYSTTGSTGAVNAQPILTESWRGPTAVAHNGNLVNASNLRHLLEREGAIFQSTSDTEVILHLLARSRTPDLQKALIETLREVRGAYSLVLLTPRALYVARDPYGVRPLCLGQFNDAWVVASETCAFDLIAAQYVREIRPGELLRIENGDCFESTIATAPRRAYCIFEHVYFSRPDSLVFERSVQLSRCEMGRQLAREHPIEADVVVPVPDSGVPAALGYAQESGIPFDMALIRNHYVGRTFIEPRQSIRHFGVKVKLNPVRQSLADKRVILIDDSIVRGTTSRKIVQMVRAAGAREIHLRISSPPTIGPCYYGIDTPTHSELIANNKTLEEIREFTTADTLAYLSLDGLRRAVDADSHFCTACFDREYPIPISHLSRQQDLFDLIEEQGRDAAEEERELSRPLP
ncbi:MAG TPA: amidophosphoribosyltransferase [Acidobacteriota bacterium]|nr:amidophosphoribosyltransferase [Acidobacteriota bacterium]